eukprot:COSAG02_NODE_963_length_15604_cov_10.737117_2_plen_68_part_00
MAGVVAGGVVAGGGGGQDPTSALSRHSMYALPSVVAHLHVVHIATRLKPEDIGRWSCNGRRLELASG